MLQDSPSRNLKPQAARANYDQITWHHTLYSWDFGAVLAHVDGESSRHVHPWSVEQTSNI
jgi:cytolysin (calcineurin-like family phosphatase)